MRGRIQKPQEELESKITPNFVEYDSFRTMFSWDSARRDLEGLPGGKGLNIAHECVDRHARRAPNQLAIRWLSKKGECHDLSYADLRDATNRFANVLQRLGVKKGERVFSLLGRCPELYFTALGTMKNRNVFCPLSSSFGPESLHARLQIGEAKVLVTTESQYLKKVAPLLGTLPALKHILLIKDGIRRDIAGTQDYLALMSAANPHFVIEPTFPQDPALLHFTSGTTGRPKGAIHAHEAIVADHFTGKTALDLHPGDVFWCTADPGWVTGTSYGILSPLSNGVTSIVDEADFNAERWYQILQEQKVNVWYTAPKAIRMLMQAGKELRASYDLRQLRFIASVGEPLNPEAVYWGKEVLGLPIHENWSQTETGGIMMSNFRSMEIRPGSMGKSIPGIEAYIVRRDAQGQLEVVTEPNVEGELALKRGWPSMFRGYINEDERYRKCFAGEFYLTGDLARRDSDGYFWFVGRAEDVIKSSGHLIGPFEVESVLIEHPAVAEAAVIGKPDPIAFEIIKAFVSLKNGFAPSENLRLELIGFARSRLGAVVAPKEIEFRKDLPRTRSGKLMRRLLKAEELDLPTGDTSTLEKTAA